MNTASVGTPSQKMSVKKPRLSLVRDAKPKVLDQLREALRARHYSRRTEQTYCNWERRFIFFHNVRHPEEMAETDALHKLLLSPIRKFLKFQYTCAMMMFGSLMHMNNLNLYSKGAPNIRFEKDAHFATLHSHLSTWALGCLKNG